MHDLKVASSIFITLGVILIAIIHPWSKVNNRTSDTKDAVDLNLVIPTVDLSDVETLQNNCSAFAKGANLLYTACTTSGFFYIKVATEVQAQMLQVLTATKEFFQLPSEDKIYLSNDNASQMMISGRSIAGTGSGYRGFGLDPNFRLDTRESFVMGPDVVESRPLNYSGSGTTYWPSSDKLPHWKETMQNYTASLLNVSTILRQLIAVALGLDRSFFDQVGFFDKPTWLLGLNHYQAIPSNIHTGVFGIRPHADSGIFTLLLSDGKPGLQICINKSVNAKDRIWWNIPFPPNGHLIVNLGKNLERWTNGHFKATLHRVILSGSEERYSVPFFYETNIDTLIEPIEKFCKGSGCIYKPIKAAQLLLDRLQKSEHDDDFE